MPDTAKESFQETEEKVEIMAAKLGISDLDYDKIRRISRFSGTCRPIELSFLRTKDKIELLRAKVKLRNMDEYKKLFISNARTPKEIKVQKKLMEFAKLRKAEKPQALYRFRNQILELKIDEVSTLYRVNKEGDVEEIRSQTPMEADASQQNSQNHQPFRKY